MFLIIQEVDSNNWHVTINFITGVKSHLLPALTNAQLRKRSDEGMIFVDGWEWDDGYLDQLRENSSISCVAIANFLQVEGYEKTRTREQTRWWDNCGQSCAEPLRA